MQTQSQRRRRWQDSELRAVFYTSSIDRVKYLAESRSFFKQNTLDKPHFFSFLGKKALFLDKNKAFSVAGLHDKRSEKTLSGGEASFSYGRNNRVSENSDRYALP
jgi:hypothetical protein